MNVSFQMFRFVFLSAKSGRSMDQIQADRKAACQPETLQNHNRNLEEPLQTNFFLRKVSTENSFTPQTSKHDYLRESYEEPPFLRDPFGPVRPLPKILGHWRKLYSLAAADGLASRSFGDGNSIGRRSFQELVRLVGSELQKVVFGVMLGLTKRL